MGIFCFLIGPSQILALPETLFFTITGLTMTGVFLAPMIIPVLPEMIEAANKSFPDKNKHTRNNYASGLFNTGLGLGTCIGPLYGAMTYERLNFRLTEDILALIILVFTVAYFFSAGGYSAFSRSFNRTEEEEKRTSKYIEPQILERDATNKIY